MSALLIYILTIFVPDIPSEPIGLKVGDKAPDFSVLDQKGDEVSLYDALDEGKVILTFYRGAWCRYCIKQMKDYQDSISMINNAGASIIAVSPEHEKGIQLTVEKAGVMFSLLRDRDLGIMLDYKVITKDKVEEYRRLSQQTEDDISRKYVPVPALYIINQDGIVEFVSFNPDYKQRMTVQSILSKLE